MRFFLQLALFVLWQASVFAQTKLLEKYNFSEGGYYLVGLQTMKGDENAFADSTKEFYIEDIKILQAIQKDWVFTKPSPQYACGYHYEVFVCKNGVGLESFNINLNCNLITSDKGYFYFDTKKLTKYHKKFKKLRIEALKLDSLSFEEVENYAKTLHNKPNILFSEVMMQREKYEGRFDFQYKHNETDLREQKEKILQEVKTEIENNYPNEIFELEFLFCSKNEAEFCIKCNKSLAQKFSLYKKTDKWTAFEKYIFCYWK